MRRRRKTRRAKRRAMRRTMRRRGEKERKGVDLICAATVALYVWRAAVREDQKDCLRVIE